MDNNPELNPQVPGQVPGVDAESLQPLLELTVGELATGLSALTSDEVDALLLAEVAGENREAYVNVLQTEQMRRLEDALPLEDLPPPKAEDAPAPLGDLVNYANLHADEIDPSTLDRAVLSKDGWVLPHPKLSPE